MRKIPTIFERDWDGDRSRVLNIPNPECQWVFDGEGIPTRKYDGTCCLLKLGELYKRHEVKAGKKEWPVGFQFVDADEKTGKVIGWLPVKDGPEDQWHREAFELLKADYEVIGTEIPEGTYELVGPKIQGNAENFSKHTLLHHALETHLAYDELGRDRTYEGFKKFFEESRIGALAEGIVFHHPDGRMGKIKARDFGILRKK